MEIYVINTINNINKELKLSLFGDEEIEITKTWKEQQAINGYGSYSNSFSVPCDANNNNIFNNFYLLNSKITIGFNLNPNYFLKARLIINSFEILGNIVMNSVSYKKGVPYSYNINFYGDEKDLTNYLNTSSKPKLNDFNPSNFSFLFNYSNVTNSWVDSGYVFVPQMANENPFVFRETPETYNINYINTLTGMSMTDLRASYNFKHLLNEFLTGITLTHSSSINIFLNDLYLMPNTKIEYSSGDLTYINTEVFTSYIENLSPSPILPYGTGFGNILKMTPNENTTTGILNGNTDTTSYHNITDYTLSNNYYTSPSTGLYKFIIDVKNINTPIVQSFPRIFIKNLTSGDVVAGVETFNSAGGKNEIEVDLESANDYHVLLDYFEEIYDGSSDEYSYSYYNFSDGELDATLKIEKINQTPYDFNQNIINFKDMFVSDFFNNFCKSFNIIYTFNYREKKLNTYFWDELSYNIYDLSNYLLEEDYVINNVLKYKLINYKFSEGKDINNIAYKNVIGYDFGELYSLYNYDVGVSELKYTSLFTTFPRTTINKTDIDNVIIEDTEIPLHSELNESLKEIKTDFLLFYKLPMITGLTSWSLADSSSSYTSITSAADYGPTNSAGTWSLDYNSLNVIEDNISNKYETEMKFKLPQNILYKIRVQDRVVVYGIYYEIKEININLKTGKSKIKLKTI